MCSTMPYASHSALMDLRKVIATAEVVDKREEMAYVIERITITIDITMIVEIILKSNFDFANPTYERKKFFLEQNSKNTGYATRP